ncbi:MAG TPA: ATP-binding protein [Chthonomonadaceae bacterium]|nr:ATP-binding protein [Chthonomonadaceae bacterium]
MKQWRFLTSVRARLTLWNVGVLALALLVAGGMLRLSLARNLTASVNQELAAEARFHQVVWARGLAGPWRGSGPPWERRPMGLTLPGVPAPPPPRHPPAGPGPPSRRMTRVFDRNGRSLFPSGEGAPWDRRAFALAAQGQELYSTVRVEGEPLRVFSAPLRQNGQVAGVVQVVYSLADVERALTNLNQTLLALAPVALALAAAGGLFLTGRMLRPVRAATQAAARIGAGELSRRLPVVGGDEFAELAATLNAMLGRLEQAFEQQRRFTADASHELRTPLTVIKANTSLALSDPDLPAEHRQAWEATDRAASRMRALVQDLLLLARSDAGEFKFELRPTLLREVVESAIEAAQVPGSAPVANEVSGELAVFGEPGHLVRLFVNLLTNAIRHTPPCGCISVSARAEGEFVRVLVEDTGTGIPPEHLPHVLDRFYRVDSARSREEGGTGLGLAISKSIAEAHGGILRIDSVLGQGTTVQITLRRAPTAGEGSRHEEGR